MNLPVTLGALVGFGLGATVASCTMKKAVTPPEWVQLTNERIQEDASARSARQAEWNRQLEINRNKAEPEKEGDEE